MTTTTPTAAATKTQLNPLQQQVVDAGITEAIRVLAGAGTGKTTIIASRFVHLVKQIAETGIHRAHERILSVTFTVKATEEMKTRIHKRLLEEGCLDPEDPFSSRVWVTTFHTCCNRILRDHALELGLPPDFELLDTLGQDLLFQRLLSGIKEGDYNRLTPSLRWYDLASDISPDILSLQSLAAIPTESLEKLLERLPGIIQKIKATGLSPKDFRALARSQTTAYTDTLKTLPVYHPHTGDLCSTHQDYAQLWDAHLKRYSHDHFSFLGDFSLADPDDPERYYKDQLDWIYKLSTDEGKIYIDYNGRRKAAERFQPGHLEMAFLDHQLAVEYQLIDLITATYCLYQYSLLQRKSCDFDDLINYTIQLLEFRPDLQAHYQDLFRAIIVDEFQDSNASQLKLLKLLMNPTTPNLTVVGDEKQSIYGFRHAQPENLDLIFQQTQHTSVTLKDNYRSHPKILTVSNRLTQTITDGDDQTLNSGLEQESDRSDVAAEHPVTWITLGRQEFKPGYNGKETLKDEPIQAVKNREATLIAVEIANLLLSGNTRPNDIAVLTRNHKKTALIQEALTKLGIPAIKVKHQGFFQELVIKNALALLRLMVNLHDPIALTAILQTRLNQHQLRQFVLLQQQLKQNKSKNVSLFQALEAFCKDPHLLPNFSTDLHQALTILIKELTAIRLLQDKMTPPQLFHRLSQRIGLVNPDSMAVEDVEARIQLKLFQRLLWKLTADHPFQPTLTEILNHLAAYETDPNIDLPAMGNPDGTLGEQAVQLMTVHAAKGLEWPVVFVAFADTPAKNQDDTTLIFDPQYGEKAGFGLILGKDNGDSTLKKKMYDKLWKTPRQEAEEKRLFYVALTRAKQKLYITRARQSNRWTGPDPYFHGTAPMGVKVMVETDEADAIYLKTAYWQVSLETLQEQIQTLLDIQDSTEPTSFKKNHLSIFSATPQRSQEASPQASVPITFSHSALAVAQRCPVKYWLQYRTHLPQPTQNLQQSDPSPLIVGNAVHDLIHKHYLYQGNLSQDTIQAIIQSHLSQPENPTQTLPDSLSGHIQALYNSFLSSDYTYTALTQKDTTLQIHSELPFEYLINSPSSADTLRLTGKLDLLLHHPATDTYRLIDFKTNRHLTTAQQAQYFEQLWLYRQGFLTQHPQNSLPSQNLSLVHLTHTGVQSYFFTQDETTLQSHLNTQITDLLTTATQLNLPERPTNIHCQTPTPCPYQSVCPRAEAEQQAES